MSSKIKDLLEKEEIYKTTLTDCERWYKILNKEIFDNKLPKKAEFDIRRRRNNALAYLDITKGVAYIRYLMNIKYANRKLFTEILAHEMIHHYQALNEQSTSHGPSFFKWKETFKNHGLNLKRVY